MSEVPSSLYSQEGVGHSFDPWEVRRQQGVLLGVHILEVRLAERTLYYYPHCEIGSIELRKITFLLLLLTVFYSITDFDLHDLQILK